MVDPNEAKQTAPKAQHGVQGAAPCPPEAKSPDNRREAAFNP
jgi:hypothetical protein